MPYLAPEEIITHLYDEVTEEISRGDDTIIQSAIDAAIEEAGSYLSNYNVDAIFAAIGSSRNAILLLFVKDITVWHYIQLSNVAVDMNLRMERYKSAIKWLEKVQSGISVPKLPLPDATACAPQNNFIKWGGNKKRETYFN